MGRAWVVLLGCAAVYAAGVVWSAARLPEQGVAMHVNAHGVVNAYGSRADAIGLFVGLGAFLLVLGVLVLGSVSRIPPRLINVPHRDYWAEPSRLPTLRRMLAWDIAVLFGLPLLALSVLPVDLTLTTLDPAGHGQAAFLVAIGALVVGIAGYTVWMATVRYRPS